MRAVEEEEGRGEDKEEEEKGEEVVVVVMVVEEEEEARLAGRQRAEKGGSRTDALPVLPREGHCSIKGGSSVGPYLPD